MSWSEELPAHILAVLTFIGAAYLTRTSEHLGFDAVVRLLSTGLKRAVMAGSLILMAGFGALLAWYGGIAAASFGARQLISVDLPMALFRGAMPLGGALITVICLVRLAGLLTGTATSDAASVMIPQMKKRGYPVAFAAAVTSTSATMAIVVPASLNLILYA